MVTSPKDTNADIEVDDSKRLRCELKGCPRGGCQLYTMTWKKVAILYSNIGS